MSELSKIEKGTIIETPDGDDIKIVTGEIVNIGRKFIVSSVEKYTFWARPAVAPFWYNNRDYQFLMKDRNRGWFVYEDLLLAKLQKLKALLLLTDPAVSNVSMNDVTARQWNEFIKEFPDEGAL